MQSVIEREIQVVLSRASASPEAVATHVREAFMQGMMLGARLQAQVAEPSSSQQEGGWCRLPEKS